MKMNNKQEKIELQETQARINAEIIQVLKELLAKAFCDLTAAPERESLEFKEIRALMKGIKTGAQLYSMGIATLIKHLGFSEYLNEYTRDLRKQNDQGGFALIDSLAPPPPETGKGGNND
jgi:rubrerythrin